MPYIKREARDKFLDLEYEIFQANIEDPGELNYLLTLLCLRFEQIEGLKYKTINNIVGALECCKQEYYRKQAISYEDKKATENGDVYE